MTNMTNMTNVMKIRRTPELLGRAVSSVGAALVAALVPKCPLCVAAYLTSFGLGAGASHSAAPFVRPFGFTVAGVAALALVLGVWRSRRRRARGCCGHAGRLARGR